jgi:malonyl-CoA O-methyltransferase
MSGMDKLSVRRAFAHAAAHYDTFAHLQRQVAAELLPRMAINTVQGRVLDIGCGTGFLTQQLQRLGGYQHLVALDIALPMLHRCRQQLAEQASYVCGEAEALPFQAASLDSLFSSLALQWCEHLPAALQEFQRVLKPGGQLVFATFGAQTLQELKAAWATVDEYRHVNDFYSAAQLRALLQVERRAFPTRCHTHAIPGNRWQCLAVERQVYAINYVSVSALLHELKGLGAQSVSSGRKPQLTTKAQMQAMFDAYPRTEADTIVASFDVIWVKAKVGQ